MAARSQTPDDYEGDEQPDYKLEYDGDETKKVHKHPALDAIGTARFKNGDVYRGPYKEGKRHGPGGRYTFAAGGGHSYYEGDYVANRREGHGVHVTIDGARYEGQWRDNVREGKGTYTYPNGDTYVGHWLKHLKHGDGVYTYAKTKAHITGKWSAGQLLHGTWAMGSTRYTGPFSGGVPDGEGLFVRHDGRSFSGRFSEQKWMHDMFERPHHTALPPQPAETVDVFKKVQRALDKSVWKVDHFESIYKLPKEIEGVPNYRSIEGFPIFGAGQPTYEGLQLMLEKIMEMQINEVRIDRVVWVNMRVEPVIYVNDHSFAPRDVNNLNENMELEGLSIQNLLALEERLTQRIRTDTRRRGGLHHYYRDTFAENPEDRKNTELTFDVKDLTSGIRSVTQAYEVLKEEDFAVDFVRVPIIDERAPAFAEFDALFSLLRELESSTAVCFNCQMGKGRTTTGTVVATLIRRALDEPPEEEKEEHKDEELVDEDDGEGDDLDPEEKKARDEERAKRKEEEKKEKEAKSDAPPDYKLGQYSVIMKLTRALGEKKGDKIKAEVDDAIDRCKHLQNLRECIWDTKINYERESTVSRRAFWKRMSLNFLERYFYLIAFNAFIKDALAEPPAAETADGSDPPPPLTFTKWVDDHKDLLALLGTREAGALAEFNWT